MLKIGPKARLGKESLVPEAPPDDPIYTRGFAIGMIRATSFPKNSGGTTPPPSNGKQDPSSKILDEDQTRLHDMNEKNKPRTS